MNNTQKPSTENLFRQVNRKHKVACPLCGLNLRLSALKLHLGEVHNNLSMGEQKLIHSKVEKETFCLANQLSQVDTPYGTVMVTSEGWLKCPKCKDLLKLKSLEEHMITVHRA